MLTDLSIDAAQKILRNQFTKSGGLQDTVLGQKLMFKEVSRPFLQILHNGRKHWLLVSNYNCQPGEINLYDSLYHGRVTDQVKAQICTIYKCPTDKLVINVKPCQCSKLMVLIVAYTQWLLLILFCQVKHSTLLTKQN